MLINFDHLKTTYNALVHKLKSFRGNWNQNDPAADDYIKNRPFYTESNEILIVSNLTRDEYENYPMPPCNFVPGDKYIVIWNGERYDDVICYRDGSYNVLGENYPFYIDDDGGDDLYISADGDFTVSIYQDKTVVHKLDNKFIDMPDNIVTDDALAAVAKSGSYFDLNDTPSAVLYNTTQNLTTSQQNIARNNIGAASELNLQVLSGSVVTHTSQNLTTAKQAQARANIGAAKAGESYTKEEVYTKDELYKTKTLQTTITWDGNIDGITDIITDSNNQKFYKISDFAIPAEYVSYVYSKVTNVGGASATGAYFTNSADRYGIGDRIIAGGYSKHAIVVTDTDTEASPGLYAYAFINSDGVCSQFTSYVEIWYSAEQYGLFVDTPNYSKSIIGIDKDGAVFTERHDGKKVTMLSSASMPDVYSKQESDKRYLIQSDWSQTNISSADYIKNRTHGYEDVVEISEATISDTSADKHIYLQTTHLGAGSVLNFKFGPSAVDVKFDSVKDRLFSDERLRVINFAGQVTAYCGADYDESTGVYTLDVEITYISGTMQCAIEHNYSSIKKIDEKYLPDEYQGVRTAVITENEGTGEVSINITFEEAENAIKNGVFIDFNVICIRDRFVVLNRNTQVDYCLSSYDVPCFEMDAPISGKYYFTPDGISKNTPSGGK